MKAFRLQQKLQRIQNMRLIIRNQDAWRMGSGNVIFRPAELRCSSHQRPEYTVIGRSWLRMRYDAALRVINRDSSAVQCKASGLIDVDFCFFKEVLRDSDSGFSDSKRLFRGKRVIAGHGSKLLLLLGDVESLLRQIARLLGSINARLGLLDRVLRIAN